MTVGLAPGRITLIPEASFKKSILALDFSWLRGGSFAKPFSAMGRTIPRPNGTATTIDRWNGLVRFLDVDSNDQWCEYSEINATQLSSLPWLHPFMDAGNLENLFCVFDWKRNNGATYSPTWVE